MEKINEKHRGQIVEYAVRMNGFSLTTLAKQLGVNRRTLYNWFQTEQLRLDIIIDIGLAIQRDFSVDFPDMFVKEDFIIWPISKVSAPTLNDLAYKEKYIMLLEVYNNLILNLTQSEVKSLMENRGTYQFST